MWGGSAGSGVFWLNGNDWIHVTPSPVGYNYSFNNVYTMCVDAARQMSTRRFVKRCSLVRQSGTWSSCKCVIASGASERN
jgi:hypothetical protein